MPAGAPIEGGPIETRADRASENQPDASAPAPLGEHVGRGLAWVLFSFSASKLVGVGLSVALGFLLLPEEMGVWAATLGFFGFMQSCRDAGVATLLVQRGEKEYESLVGPAYWLSTAFHFFCALLAILIGLVLPLVEPDKKEMGHTLLLCSLAMIAMAPATMAQARLKMKFRFHSIAVISSISALIRAMVILGGALLGAGAVSFVLGLICLALFESIALSRATGERMWAHPAQPRRWLEILWTVRWSIAVAFATSSLAVGDWAALSLTAEPAVIGIYFFSVSLMMQAEQALAGTASQVLFPIFSRIKDEPARLAQAMLRTLRALALISCPVSIAVGILADPLIRFVWSNDRWNESILCLTALTIFSSFRICFVAPVAMLQAQGRFRAMFVCNAIVGGSLFVSALIGGLLFAEPLKIAICTGGTLGPICLVVTMLVVKKVGLPRRRTLTALVRPWLIAVIVGGGVYLLDRELVTLAKSSLRLQELTRWGHFLRLIAGGMLFSGLYMLAARMVLVPALRDALSIMPARLRALGERVLRLRASDDADPA